jgi:hypothetical protein
MVGNAGSTQSVENPQKRVNYIRVKVFTAVAMRNAVFWDIKPSSYLTGNTSHLRHRAQPVNAM